MLRRFWLKKVLRFFLAFILFLSSFKLVFAQSNLILPELQIHPLPSELQSLRNEGDYFSQIQPTYKPLCKRLIALQTNLVLTLLEQYVFALLKFVPVAMQ